MAIAKILLYGMLLFIIYKPEIIPAKISKDSYKTRIFSLLFLITLQILSNHFFSFSFFSFSFGLNFPTLLFYCSFTFLIYLLSKPELIPDKIFYEARKFNDLPSLWKKRKFILACSAFIVIPLFFLMSNENYNERETKLQEIEMKRDEEAKKLKKIEVLKGLGVSNASLLSEKERDFLLDSVENKNCRDSWIAEITEEFGQRDFDLRNLTEHYDVNKDCKQAKDLYYSLQEKKEKKEKEREVFLRQNPCYNIAGYYSGTTNTNGIRGTASLKVTNSCQFRYTSSMPGYGTYTQTGKVKSFNTLVCDDGSCDYDISFKRGRAMISGYNWSANLTKR